jgi:hypothetical protein
VFHQRPDIRHTQVTFNVVFNPPSLHTIFILKLETVICLGQSPPSLTYGMHGAYVITQKITGHWSRERETGTVKDLDGRNVTLRREFCVSDELLSPPFDTTVASITFLIRLRMSVGECVKELAIFL